MTRPAAVAASTHPPVTVASDGRIQDCRGHPGGAGTFAKFLRGDVRQGRHVSLMEALRKMLFEPGCVRERAGYAKPARCSEGFDHALVAGQAGVGRGQLQNEVRPGATVRGTP